MAKNYLEKQKKQNNNFIGYWKKYAIWISPIKDMVHHKTFAKSGLQFSNTLHIRLCK